MSYTDTIAAISTPAGTGGIGTIRVSGPAAREICDRVFVSHKNRRIIDAPGYTALYGRVHGPDGPIDEAVALVFAAPASYTGEDVVELSVHGGSYIVKTLLRALLAVGARLAEGGEFTRRAFLNGKLDLAQAESVMQLISAKGEEAHRAAMQVKDGALSREVEQIRAFLLRCAGDLAAYIDYPDEDMPGLESGVFLRNLEAAEEMLSHLLTIYDAGRLLREGVDTVIVGRPNVGKSTLMNLLVGEERSIVTDVAGTTRDIVEESVMLGGICLRLADTAGLRKTDDRVEAIGVQRTRDRLERARLVLLLLDASSPLTAEDRALLSLCEGKQTVVVINKSDLPEQIDRSAVEAYGFPVVTISALDRGAAALLGAAVEEVTGLSDLSDDPVILSTERQRACAEEALAAVRETKAVLTAGITLDAVGVCLDDALNALFSLTGERVTTAVADEVFSRFCVGK
ncbi:MAG: tRNA uridine-5-carboxymethylaminomethyl(34) synthesis GTPase MnmE [Candidatus Howiella sp.]|jgi:tRNA modification GTPase